MGSVNDAPILHEFACRCAEYALSFVESPDSRSIAAIEAKRKWLRGEITDAELHAAQDAAWDAACDVAQDAAWDAACDVAQDAATTAAQDAAMTAACDAAWDAATTVASRAARDAAREHELEILRELLEEGDEQ